MTTYSRPVTAPRNQPPKRVLSSGHTLLAGALLAATAVGCSQGPGADEISTSTIEQALPYIGYNNVPPYVFDTDPLKRSTTDAFGVTTGGSSGTADPLRLCANDPGSGSSCTLKSEWNQWRLADAANRNHVLKGIAKCAVASGFQIYAPDGSATWGGQWNIAPEWKTGRLTGVDKRERMTSCILTLLNGNNVSLSLCIVGPGAGFDAPCSDSSYSVREGGFFGNLFSDSPRAYVAGPDTAQPPTNGRACFATQGSYCCDEDDSACTHRLVLAGAIVGNPATNYDNKRCNSALVDAGGGLWYCPSFYSKREPGRSYTNVFTTFIPPAQ